MPSHPKNVPSLRSRIVFFLRDWSLTLFSLPLLLLGWSLWMLPLLAASMLADSRLQRLYAEFDRSSEAGFEWDGVKRLQVHLWIAVLAAILLATVAYGLKGTSYAIFMPAIAFIVPTLFDPRSGLNIRSYPDTEPLYKRRIPYPGMGIPSGPLSLIFLSELIRVISVWGMLAASLTSNHPLLPFAAGIFGSVVPICYWMCARIVVLNDELRLRKPIGP